MLCPGHYRKAEDVEEGCMVYLEAYNTFIWVDVIFPNESEVEFVFEIGIGKPGLETFQYTFQNYELVFVADLGPFKLTQKTLPKKDADYLWACMPKWVKEVPGPEHAFDPMWFGTLSREGDLKVHEEVKRILNIE